MVIVRVEQRRGWRALAARLCAGLCLWSGLLSGCATEKQVVAPRQPGTAECGTAARCEDPGSLHQACEGGDASVCVNLGLAYAHGQGAPQDFRRAAALFEKACEGGAAMGCSGLGVLYAQGKGVAPNMLRAVSLYRKACERRGRRGVLQPRSRLCPGSERPPGLPTRRLPL
ncbi:tetratricopeptide repeat protein [Pyxidicoccus sp. 3LFB2]